MTSGPEVPNFHNATPKSRKERLGGSGANTWTAFEKKSHLVGKLCGGTMVEEPLLNPLAVVHNAPAFANDSERFERDAAATEFEQRAQIFKQKEVSLASS